MNYISHTRTGLFLFFSNVLLFFSGLCQTYILLCMPDD
jgi:hypothetical protein